MGILMWDLLCIEWLYAAVASSKNWDAKRKSKYKIRRRNWRRIRVRQEGAKHVLFKQSSLEECWEYGRKSDHNHTFHVLRSTYDNHRRRRLTRKLVYSDTGYESGKRQV